MTKYWTFILLLTLGCAACHSHDESEEIKKAKEVHEGMIALYGQLDSVISLKTRACVQMGEAALNAGDTTLAMQLDSTMAILNVLHTDLMTWDEALVEIPGHAHTHADGEECNHDHESEKVMKGISDQEVLEIQLQLEADLKAIEERYNAITLR